MPHSSSIFGALLIGFIVFITLRGELPKYIAVLIGPSHPSGPAPDPTYIGAEDPNQQSSGGLGGLFGDLGGLFGSSGESSSVQTAVDSTISFGTVE